MDFPSRNNFMNPPYPPFLGKKPCFDLIEIVPVPRGPPFTDKDGKPTIPTGPPPTIPYGVPYFGPPPNSGPPPNAGPGPGHFFPAHPYPMMGNYLPPHYHRFYQDAHMFYFNPEMKMAKFPHLAKFPTMEHMIPRDLRAAGISIYFSSWKPSW